MTDRPKPDELSVEELEHLLYEKKRQARHLRLQRLRGEGRVVDVQGRDAPNPAPQVATRRRSTAAPTGALRRYALKTPAAALAEVAPAAPPRAGRPWRRVADRFLLFVEVGAVIGLLAAIVMIVQAVRETNEPTTEAPVAAVAVAPSPTSAVTPVIDVVVLPSGHKPPIDGRAPEPGEAGDIPEHLLPIISAYVPPPVPTPGPEQARRIQIPAISVDKPIVQGDDWEALKKGVGQHIGSAQPGQLGNLVLSAHNDIFGEIFRHLDRLSPGDEVVVHTERQTYTYVIRELQVVQPTDVWVMAPTEHASATLISCYPYLVNNKRIIVFADLATTTTALPIPWEPAGASIFNG